ncbi:cytochrome c oxidase assembly protein COX19-like [Crassostrea angulata]|uniref:Cytochrome c oxidase assembly protein COX19 n=1 Tax=Magallana gigas TaxID=29159 RepID=A0A8W8LHS5_MAGGI|nr:cytochrome c oxidase assembly protein COX19-like [Crassostrea gigas]XP_052685753.1 cytochrome c oxidase assembly protein COX19-like [Crassostrea angulata]|eukprot:XP_011449540.1 PREDICTED: cytochrome c oxidase assembly protein COX19-like [Crassostrea gigas]
MSTPGTRQITKAPDKGIFPLDHEGLCKSEMRSYMRCLMANNRENSKCRSEAKSYLQCRMDNDLMQKEDWKSLGFHEEEKDNVKNAT